MLLKMKAYKLISILLVVACYLVGSAHATGKGPTGIYAITDRYVAIGDFNFDAIFILDVYMGGIVGQFITHEEQYDPESVGLDYEDVEAGLTPIYHWAKPIGLATCDSCRELYMTSHKELNFYRVHLKRPLKEMADDNDFSDFTESSTLEEYKIWGQDKEHVDDSLFRWATMKRDGSAGFFAHHSMGLFQFLKQDPSVPGNNALELSGAELIKSINNLKGVNLSDDERFLIATAQTVLYVFDLSDPSFQTFTTFNLKLHCRYTWTGSMFFFDSVMIGGVIYAVGRPLEELTGGFILFRIESDNNNNGDFKSCQSVAGGFLQNVGWVDGDGDDVRLSRPHAMALLPGTTLVALTDIDNRAVRIADVSKTPVHVSTVSYDEGLWNRLYITGGNVQKNGVPHFLAKVRSTKTVSEAYEVCNGKNETLCTLYELRSYWSTQHQGHDTIVTWTSQDCHSCWLYQQGVCLPPSDNETVSYDISRSAWAWGSEYQMLAILSTSAEGLARMRTECTDRTKAIETDAVCCDAVEPPIALFYGRVTMIGEGEEEGYPGFVWIRLIRKKKQAGSNKTIFKTVQEGFTRRQDGTFEISLHKVLNDCEYYLRFELDEKDGNEFVSGGDSSNVSVARSIPRRVAYGGRYEINVAVRAVITV